MCVLRKIRVKDLACRTNVNSLLSMPRNAQKRTRVVREVSVHFEYLENRSSGLDITRQPVRGDITLHP